MKNDPSRHDRFAPALAWFQDRGWEVFPFQQEAWEAYLDGHSGLVNAPTGFGKTYSLFFGPALEFLQEVAVLPAGQATRSHPVSKSRGTHRVTSSHPVRENPTGLRILWITPVRALAREIQQSCQRAADGLGLGWQVAVRTGDTTTAERTRQKQKPPEMLVTTPESLHLMLASKGYAQLFQNLRVVVCDEWHELVGNKRGVLVELGLSRLKALLPGLKIWGISATVGNLDEALGVLLGDLTTAEKLSNRQVHRAGPDPDSVNAGLPVVIRADVEKRYEVITIFPDEIEKFPWSGHLGIRLLDKVLPVIYGSKSTLIFTNTRSQCEIWYQRLLDADPNLAGQIAMHHGSLSREIRDWVEENLHTGLLRAVVCTSSLDLGVDFRPVESVVQVGSPKGVARFMQRAGRAGHQPGAVSRIYFLPTHSLEIAEGAALRRAIQRGEVESRIPYIGSIDVLLQYLVTLAVGDGFHPASIYPEIKGTFSFAHLDEAEWRWCLAFISQGGRSLAAYDEYKKVEVGEDGVWRVKNRMIAMRHRLSIGAIVSEATLHVEYVGGKHLGTIEEYFISQLKPGDTFWFAGRILELVRVKDMTVQVRRSSEKKGKVPSWLGGRMPLSSELAAEIRNLIGLAAAGDVSDPEMEKLVPLLETQQQRSHLPEDEELLLEYFSDTEGYHLLCYPFEGRFVHEGMGALLAWRIARLQPMTFSIAMNDYGFELLSDQPIPVQTALDEGLFSLEHLSEHIAASLNSVEMARRRFRDIAGIAGLVFKGFPGKQKKDRHLQASSQLFFNVFLDYEPDNLLLREAFDEVMTFQLEETRLRAALERIGAGRIVFKQPAKATPFSFPIIVDRLREKLSSEKLEDRIKRMRVQLEK